MTRAVEAEVAKALRTIAKAKMTKTKIQVREGRESEGRMCLDSGADRIVRSTRSPGEVEGLEKMEVQMADGVIVEMFKNETGTLVSRTEIQAIIPLVPVLQCLGLKLKKRETGMTLEREDQKIQLYVQRSRSA